MNELILKKSFSKAAKSYDNFAYLQKQIGLGLLSKLKPSKNSLNILDIGTGTGWLANQIEKIYPKADIIGIDFAFGMIDFAKKKNLNSEFLVSDALHIPIKNQYFDLVISNATYQLVQDYNQAFEQVKRVLKEKGKFYFTCFGNKTLNELKQVLSLYSIDMDYKLPGKEKIISALINSGFKNIEIKMSLRKEFFKSAFDLANWLKSIGANKLNRPIFFSRGDWNKINQQYVENFSQNKKIVATFEIFEVSCL